MTEDVLYRPELWSLDPDVLHLNHGSFGACPSRILERNTQLRQQMESNTSRFFEQELPELLETAREALGLFLGAPAQDLVFVDNATTGVSTVLANLDLTDGDRILVTDHGYNACSNAARYFANRASAEIDVINLRFPGSDANEIVEEILGACTAHTRLLLIDHITSPTALIMPLEVIIPAVQQRGIQVLVDGAHAPGMLPLRLTELGADYYTGNCHKWMCTPKGSALLYVRRDRQQQIKPLAISHGANSTRRDRSRFRLEADWTGTSDPTPYLCVPHAIKEMASLYPGGWADLRSKNRELALQGRDMLLEVTGEAAPCPDEMISHLAGILLPEDTTPYEGFYEDPLQDALIAEHAVQVPIMRWPALKARILRISAQAYNSPAQFEHLASALKALL